MRRTKEAAYTRILSLEHPYHTAGLSAEVGHIPSLASLLTLSDLTGFIGLSPTQRSRIYGILKIVTASQRQVRRKHFLGDVRHR